MSLGEGTRPAGITESDQLNGLKRADFFLKAAELAEQSVSSGQFDRKHIPPGIPGTISPISKERIRQNIWRATVTERLEQGDDLGFNPEELAILRSGLRIAFIMDRVYSRYKKEMVNSELGKRLASLPNNEATRWAEEHGITNPYTVYKEDDGEVKQIPYALAFEDEYGELDLELATLLQELGALPEHTQPFIPYFEAYRRALMETDLNKLEERWRDVDIIWMDIKGPFQPIHAMEHYIDPTRTRIDPEFRIVIADERAKPINEQVKLTQKRLIEDMSSEYGGLNSFNISKSAMENSVALAGTTIVMSGINLDFRPAGQNVPNRGDVKAEKGVKIFMDLKTFEIRSKEMRELVAAIFGDEFADTYYRDQGFEITAGILTAGHEFNHNSFVTPETDNLLGNRTLVEETKADLGPFITLPRQLERKEISIAEIQKVMAITIAKILRIFKIKEKPGQQPYYISSVVEFNLMKQAGILNKTDSQWVCDLSLEKTAKFFELAKGALTHLANAYDNYSQEELGNFLATYFIETPEILELVAKAKSVSP